MDQFIRDCGFTLLRDETVRLPELNNLVIVGRRDENRPGDGVKVRATLEELMQGTNPDESILLLQHEINMDAQRAAIDIAHAAGVRIVLNPAPAMPIPDDLLERIDIVTPNETEAQALTGVAVTCEADAQRAARVFLDKGVKNVVITMGALGVFVTDGAKSEMLPRLEVDAIDTTGAGDAYNGGFVMALSEDRDLFEAARYGNATGALSVTRLGTAPAMPVKAPPGAKFGQTSRQQPH